MLRAFERPLSSDAIAGILAGVVEFPPSVVLGYEVAIDRALEASKLDPGDSRAAGVVEAEVAPALHTALRDLPRRILLDPLMWSWLAITHFPDFVIRRWHGGEPPDTDSPMSAQHTLRWSARPSLRGFANHAIARLFWTSELLVTDGDYTLVRKLFLKQDLISAVFERELCLHPAAAKACVARYADGVEENWRYGVQHLNLILGTVAVEYLEEREISAMLAEIDTSRP